MNQCPERTKKACYKHLVRPLLEYGNTIWDPWTQQNIDIIEAVQRRSARFVLNNYSRYSSVKTMLEHLKWPTLEERRAKTKVTMVYRIVRQQVAIGPDTVLIPSTASNRGHKFKFLVPYARTHVHKSSFFPSAIRLWNALPPKAVESRTLDSFKAAINEISVLAAAKKTRVLGED